MLNIVFDQTRSLAIAHKASIRYVISIANLLYTVPDVTFCTGDAMGYHNRQGFSTIDRDNDANNGSCAQTWNSGWWYNSCHTANLNGAYGDNTHGKGINWNHWRGTKYSLPFSEMKIKPL